ncbi:urease accessory protein UreD [Sneathiella sp.]|uniref:urease accessory protein UreD n=1 Tax=Sneathiella sp. TaxID=1964365 RepID=UPI00356B443F
MTFENFSPSDPDLTILPPVAGSAAVAPARSDGQVEIGYRLRDMVSQLTHLYQRGCGRARFPSVERADFPEAVLINTAGGLTGGDRLSFNVKLEAGARLTVSGQAAEKIYRSVGTMATIDTALEVKEGASLEWLPQETILFEKSRLKRMNTVHLETGSRLIAVEATVFGRAAHGETLHAATIQDGWKIWRQGVLIWYDKFVLDGDLDVMTARPALLAGAGAMATVLIADDAASDYLEFARSVAADVDARAAVTCRDGLLIMRVLGQDGYILRKALARILTDMRSRLAGHPVPLPKVWENH